MIYDWNMDKCEHGYYVHVSWWARCPRCTDGVHAARYGRWPEEEE